MSRLQSVKFFLTETEACSYLPKEKASFLVVDPTEKISASEYSQLSQSGFRRSGKTIYRPQCKSCDQCIPIRIPVANFVPKRRHRRVLRKNSQVSVSKVNPSFSFEHFSLYSKYINNRHHSDDMAPSSSGQYRDFLVEGKQGTNFYEYREDDILLAVSVTDSLNDGVSAIYNFYEPTLSSRALGIFMILSLIRETSKQNKRFLYIGYWIKECKKMSYKNQFKPLEKLVNRKWIREEG